MSFSCRKCCKPYTEPGSDHALYTTNCGHLIGHSCLLELINKSTNERNQFSCHECSRMLKRVDCHPVYNIPDEIYKLALDSFKLKRDLNDEYVKKQYLMGNLQRKPIILKKWNIYFEGSLQTYDIFNEYIVTTFYRSKVHENSQSLRIIDMRNGLCCYSKIINSNYCATVAINKYRENVLEFCVGYFDGTVKIFICNIKGSNFRINHGESFHESAPIQSICYLNKNKIVYSTVGGNLIVVGTTKRSKKCDLFENSFIEKCTVRDLQTLTDDAFLGLANNKIYVFSKNQGPYIIIEDNENEIINYTVDPLTNLLILLCRKKFKGKKLGKSLPSYILYEINETILEIGSKKERVYHTSKIKTIKCEEDQFKIIFNPGVFSMEEGRRSSLHSFIPNVKNESLNIHYLFSDEVSTEQGTFENLDSCISVECIKKPQMFLPNIYKKRMVVVFQEKLDVIDFYYPIFDE
ncbi:Zinc finger, RING-type domain and Zinc finger, RING/FYVE/PHD-type domain and WD40-repeat-containing domain-containing protein [Strongyloides ratti]|uniref:Zinc finger, RING-type domain and Zinc finger, RING/FYVE/PHD-type domain and WD40-repeat-containing domain-containing protein n=1 Tax=Strongyloides ratti TaxID=34506 RepID=A0A090LBX2_STRRB|nr:Zinc finger, RING-type domain and Zinc finger, RING/FYVE/PHD-type domain and WD40-repeat-containing domain-containing protein [Strongyloides ratti]CEF65040.1 Zinc finger, RING-type domain and Zinc finger, RING/FYVE/PHD-type domain and WD40-repeat-containing domain-containing protein [Strongyloides ratti]